MASVAEQWFTAQVQVKPTTLSGYRHSLDKHVLPRWGHLRLVDVSHGDVQAWITDLMKTLGPSMVRQIHLVLAGIMKYAVRDGRIVKSPCEDVQLPKIVKKKRGYLTHAQVRALASECGSNGDIVLFLAYTGFAGANWPG